MIAYSGIKVHTQNELIHLFLAQKFKFILIIMGSILLTNSSSNIDINYLSHIETIWFD